MSSVFTSTPCSLRIVSAVMASAATSRSIITRPRPRAAIWREYSAPRPTAAPATRALGPYFERNDASVDMATTRPLGGSACPLAHDARLRASPALASLDEEERDLTM